MAHGIQKVISDAAGGERFIGGERTREKGEAVERRSLGGRRSLVRELL